MSLQPKQSEFARMVALLIQFITQMGYEVTFSDAYATDGHCEGSYHYLRLAIDLNLFKDGVFLTKTEDHRFAGEFWENIGGTWGGKFERSDGNHYSLGE